MPVGIQVFGPDGSEWVGPQDYLGKLVGSVTLEPSPFDPNEQTVTAPNAISLQDPFVVNTSGEPFQVEVYQQSGVGIVYLTTFASHSAWVVPGQNQIKVSGLWSYLSYRAITVWYGSR